MNKLLKIAILIISATMFANFLFTMGVGIYKTIHAYSILYLDGIEGKPGLEIVESLDLFLVALVFLILSVGFIRLFYPDFRGLNNAMLPWLKVDDFFQLKH